MSDFLEVDFCKSRRLRVARRFDVSDGVTSEQLAGATSLGCNFPVSHRASGAPGFILSRINKQSGKDVSDLLASTDESSHQNPGPTAWLSAAPDRFITGGVALPFPGQRPVVNDTLIAGGAEVGRFVPTAGFGDGSGFRNLIVMPPGSQEYIDPGPLANHAAIRRFKTVSSTNSLEAYGLVYRNQLIGGDLIPKYVWSSTFAASGFRNSLVGTEVWEHSIFLAWYGTPPALVGYQEPVLTPPIEVASSSGLASTNGPDQTARKYSHPIVHNQFTNPDFNGTLNLQSQLTGTRPTLTIFRQSVFDTQFGYSLFTVDGSPVTFSSTALPTDQYIQNVGFGFPENNGFAQGIFKPNPASPQNFQVYGPIDQAATYEVPLAATSVTFQFNVNFTTQPLPVTIVANMPKGANQSAWMELRIFVRSRFVE